MLVPNRNYQSPAYRYGFNGKEKDDEIKGAGNSYDFGARMYDNRIGRWFKTDPLNFKYPNNSTYCYVGNNPIRFIDPDGKDIIIKGSKEHVQKVTNYLMIIYSTEEGQKMLDKMIESSSSVIIEDAGWFGKSQYSDKDITTNRGYGRLKLDNDNDLSISEKLSEGDNSSLLELMHELDHAYNDFFDKTPYDNPYQYRLRNESSALKRTNYLRKVLGLENMRTIYEVRDYMNWIYGMSANEDIHLSGEITSPKPGDEKIVEQSETKFGELDKSEKRSYTFSIDKSDNRKTEKNTATKTIKKYTQNGESEKKSIKVRLTKKE